MVVSEGVCSVGVCRDKEEAGEPEIGRRRDRGRKSQEEA